MFRFAPCPNRDLNIEDLQLALINYIYAQQKGDRFFIRIEDFDQNLDIQNRAQESIDILKKFAIDTENVVYKSKNVNIYRQLAAKLLKAERALICFSDDEGLESTEHCRLTEKEIQKRIANGEKYSIYMQKPQSEVYFKDLIQGDVSAKPEEIGKFMIIDTQGIPTHNFTCSVDDMSTNITTIISTKERISDTLQQIHIRNSLGYKADIEYAHITPIIGEKNSVIFVKWLLQEGYLPDAIINYLFQNSVQKELFYLADIVEQFEINMFCKTPIEFNMKQLRLVNRKYLQSMPSKKLSSLFGFADSAIGELLKVYLKEAATINELGEKIKQIFAPKECKGDMAHSVKLLSSIILNAPMIDDFNSFKEYLREKSGLKEEELIEVLQFLLNGCENAPKPDIIYPYIKPYLLEIARCR